MSAFVLKREYALQLPTSYVDVDRDEMEYVDGGWLVPKALITVTEKLFSTILGGMLTSMFRVNNAAVSFVIGLILDTGKVAKALHSAAVFVWSPKGIALITAIAVGTMAIAVPLLASRR
jgi:hypothetical protein